MDMDVQAMAEAAAAWLFPVGDRNPDDIHGEGWFDSRQDIERALAAMPARTLEALASARDRCLREETLGSIAHEAYCWLRAMLPDPKYSDEGSRALPLRDLGNWLALDDIIEAVPDDGSGLGGSVHLIINMYEDPEHYGMNRFGEISIRPVEMPLLGYLHASDEELANVRAFALWLQLFMRIGLGAKLSQEVFNFILAHLDTPQRLAETALERRTLDPSILAAVLDSDLPALSDGIL